LSSLSYTLPDDENISSRAFGLEEDMRAEGSHLDIIARNEAVHICFVIISSINVTLINKQRPTNKD